MEEQLGKTVKINCNRFDSLCFPFFFFKFSSSKLDVIKLKNIDSVISKLSPIYAIVGM